MIKRISKLPQLCAAVLAGFLVTASTGQPAQKLTTNPFVPIYAKGDDLSRANPKPTLIYEEVPGTKVVIPNMPAVKMQSELGECRAFSLAALLQWFTCNSDKTDPLDCQAPPAEWKLSYFGMMMYTQQEAGSWNETLVPNQNKTRSMFEIIEYFKANAGRAILEVCKPYHRLVASFSTNGEEGLRARDRFLLYLETLYKANKGKLEVELADCSECVTEINTKAGLNTDVNRLKKALRKESYHKFLYTLFFTDCESTSFPAQSARFPAHFRTRAYPHDALNVTRNDLKNKAIAVLKLGKPVLFPNLCLRFRADNYCDFGHSIVISGYRRVCESKSKNNCKDVFKVHNSWGESWQRMHNDGWTDADQIVNNVYKKDIKNPNSVASTSLLWLGDSSDYELQMNP